MHCGRYDALTRHGCGNLWTLMHTPCMISRFRFKKNLAILIDVSFEKICFNVTKEI